MTTDVPQDRVVDALEEEWRTLDELMAGLSEDEWATPTPLPGWTVKDVMAHAIGTESMLLGEAAPEIDVGAPEHVRNDIGRFNEQWVTSMRDRSPADVLTDFRRVTSRRLEALRAMDTDTWEAEGFTPAGKDSYGRFMRIRVFDCWIHEQDIRDAVGRPGGDAGAPAELALDEMTTAMGFVVGKKAGASPGSRVMFDLIGPASRQVLVELGTGEGARAAVVDELSGPPTVTLRMPVGVFVRLGGGRADPASLREQVEITGEDGELGERLVANLAFTI